MTELPILEATGGTSFAEALRVLKAQIDSDVTRLRAAGNRVHRPAVFFLTDGYPTDPSWSAEYFALNDKANPLRPDIVGFGISQCDEATIASVANFKAFISDDSLSPAAALREFARALTRSIIKSGSAAASHGMALQVPDTVPGFIYLALDQL